MNTRIRADVLLELYTRKEVASLAKVCVHTIALDVRLGLLKEIRFNRRRLRYHPDEVATYLAARFGYPAADKPGLSVGRPATIRQNRNLDDLDVNDSSQNSIDEAQIQADSNSKSSGLLSKSAKKSAKTPSRPYNVLFHQSANICILLALGQGLGWAWTTLTLVDEASLHQFHAVDFLRTLSPKLSLSRVTDQTHNPELN